MATGLPLIYTQYGKPYASTYAFAEEMLRRQVVTLGRKADCELNV
jgi:hypothetical protein